MSEQTADLLPCPFCGGSAKLERARDTQSNMYGTRQWWGVVCHNTINVGGTCALYQEPTASPEAAIDRWNMRNGVPRVRGQDDPKEQDHG